MTLLVFLWIYGVSGEGISGLGRQTGSNIVFNKSRKCEFKQMVFLLRKMHFLFLKDPFSPCHLRSNPTSFKNTAWPVGCTKLLSWCSGNCQGVMPFGAGHGVLVVGAGTGTTTGCLYGTRVDHHWCCQEVKMWAPISLGCRVGPMPSLNALTSGSQDTGDAKVTKWHMSIWIGRKDIILHVHDFLFCL